MWDDPSVCSQVAQLTVNVQATTVNAGVLAGFVDWFVKSQVDPLIAPLPFPIDRVAKWATQLLELPALGAADVADWTAAAFTSGAGPLAGEVVALALPLVAAGFVQQWVGGPIDYITTPHRMVLQYVYPTQPVSQAANDQLYLEGVWSDDVWECHTRSLGNLPQMHRLYRDQQRTRPSVADRIEMFMRQRFDYTELVGRLRGLGVTDEQDVLDWLSLRRDVPTVSELVEFARKEVTNEQSVAADGLDQGFELTQTPDMKDWQKARGIDEFLMRLRWRAHFQELSPGQIYAMRARLRKGRVPDELVMDDANAERLLREADYPPGQIARLFAIAYNPITRTDIQKGYYAGVIDKDEMTERYQDVLYSPDDARFLSDIIESDRKRRTENQTGQWTPRTILKQYRNGNITRDDASRLLETYYDDAERRDQAIEEADLLRAAESRAVCIKAVRKQYMLGAISQDEANHRLLDMHIDRPQVVALVGRWVCERDARIKEPTVRMLVTWTDQGLITAEELYRRLRNLGYPDDDAQRIVASAAITDAEKRQKEQEARARRAAADKRQQQKDADAAAARAAKVTGSSRSRTNRAQQPGSTLGANGTGSG